MKVPWSLGSLLAVTFLMNVSSVNAQNPSDSHSRFDATLNSFQTSPSLFTNGKGTTQVRIDREAGSISYELSYSGLSSPVTQAHIHFAQKGVNGNIIVYLCDNTGLAPSGTPACPDSGTVTGKVTAVDVNPPKNPLPVTDQGIAPGDFAALIAAIEHNSGYINVHTTTYPAGEIRGQLKRFDRDDFGRR
ncbi:CHRD domain-containing protein [Acidicapsa acidisoli]|uniref:CHRD domain-containing protein n=1 Tax=Acidicapsa acidisoli TaxID=1615681 RepID=UPI0021E0FC06|nr:CHRD domain-containing protein [Acidicapsa acidisoli]